MQDRIKKHDQDIRLRTEISAVSEVAHNTEHKPLWNEVKFIDRDPYYYTCRVKEAIHIRLHPNNINRDSGIEIPEAWMPTIKKHNNRRAVRQRTAEGANHWVNSKDRNAPIRAVEKTTNHSRASCFIRSHMTSRPHRLKKTSSMQSKRRDLHHTWLHRETNEELNFCCYSPRWITTTFLICVIHNRTIGGLTPPDRYRIFNTTVSFQSFHSFEAALHFTAKLKIEINVNVIVEFEVFIRHCFTGHSFFYN